MIVDKVKKPFFQMYLKTPKIRLFTFNIYISYKAHIGNPRYMHHNLQMLTYIFGYRNDMALLNIMATTINLRKSVSAIYKETQNRGTFLLFNPLDKNFTIKNNSIFYCIQNWIPGLLSNFKRVFRALRAKKILGHLYSGLSLDRMQFYGIKNAMMKIKSGLKKMYKKGKSYRSSRVPALAICFSTHDVWFRELRASGIPSVALLDTDAPNIDHIAFPLIGNQKSVYFGYLLSNIFITAVNTALLHELKVLKNIKLSNFKPMSYRNRILRKFKRFYKRIRSIRPKNKRRFTYKFKNKF